MNAKLIRFAVAAAIAAVPMGVHAIGNNEKGCLVGGAVGGIAGHSIGSGSNQNTLLGAAAGCAVGVVVNKERVKKIDAEKRQKLAEKRQKQKVARKSYRQDPRDVQASR